MNVFSTKPPNAMTEFEYSHFFDLAFQYYAAGRYAAFGRLNPVCGNLLHHALEMALKGALAKSGTSLQDLKKLNHDLVGIWTAFKDQNAGNNLAEFDKCVSDVNAYERLRYPDHVIIEGMESTIQIGDGAAIDTSYQFPSQKYTLSLEKVDTLFYRILKIASINPKFFTSGMNGDAQEYLSKK